MLHILLPNDLTLTYERSGFMETGRYAEAVAFCNALAKRSKHCRVVRYGTTPEGRPMIALLISSGGEFTPEALRKSKRPLVFVQNGIHAGEIEGKDASLMLARNMVLQGKHPELYKGVNWMILPVYNVDGHERRSPYGRINQNGPKEMGWRSTAQNYNLNRDYMKADAPETRAWLGLFHRYKPDFLIDNHTTDGADFRYAVTLSVPSGPVLPHEVQQVSKLLYEDVRALNERKGFLTAPYFAFDREHVERGITVDDFTARYTHGYVAASGRPSMLVETHVLKPYRTRVDATYQSMISAVTDLNSNGRLFRKFGVQADVPLKEGETVVLSSKRTGEKRPFWFLGWRYEPKRSEAAGREVANWVHEPVDTVTTIEDTYVADATVAAPAGYAVPSAWIDVIDRLRLHGVPMRTLKVARTAEFETYRFENVRFPGRPFEGRFQPSYIARAVRESRTLPAGTVIVPAIRLAVALLEPNAPDSLVRWGLLNTIFEQKEYFEDYAMAPVGDAMLARDAKLRSEFDAWRAKNPEASSAQRLQWLFERSPWLDTRLNAYPVVRLSGAQWRTMIK